MHFGHAFTERSWLPASIGQAAALPYVRVSNVATSLTMPQSLALSVAAPSILRTIGETLLVTSPAWGALVYTRFFLR